MFIFITLFITYCKRCIEKENRKDGVCDQCRATVQCLREITAKRQSEPSGYSSCKDCKKPQPSSQFETSGSPLPHPKTFTSCYKLGNQGSIDDTDEKLVEIPQQLDTSKGEPIDEEEKQKLIDFVIATKPLNDETKQELVDGNKQGNNKLKN
jgi:predicted amidophosphoribosyltransferase